MGVVICLWATLAAHAEPVFLIADEVTLEADGNVVALGNVEIFIDNTAMRAQKIIWDQEADVIYAPEEFTLLQPDGSVFKGMDGRVDRIMGERTAREMRGLLEARLHVAAQAVRQKSLGEDTTISSFYRARLSSCKICSDSRPPLWELQGSTITHDNNASQYYIRNATFRVLGFPLLYTPWIRIPDPSVTRYTGFLTPQLRATEKVQVGILFPYFIALSPHRDLTITPYIALNSRSLNLRYRQAFRRGFLTIEARRSKDDLVEGIRSALTIHGTYKFQNDVLLSYHYESASDDAYQNDYGYDTGLRRDRYIALTRTRRHEHFDGQLTAYAPLKTGTDDRYENNIFAGHYDRVWNTPFLGDQIRLSAYARRFTRNSDEDKIGADPRFVQARLEWHDTQILPGGFELRSALGASVQNYGVRQDSGFGDPQTIEAAFGQMSLRYPIKMTTKWATWHVTPSFGVIHENGTVSENTPLADTMLEFDTGSLLESSDLFHGGTELLETKLAYGATIERKTARSDMRFSMGRILPLQKSDALGDAQTRNTYFQVQYGLDNRLGFLGYSIVDDQGEAVRAQWKVDYIRSNWSVGLGYNNLKVSDAFKQTAEVEDWRANGSWTVNSQLSTKGSLGYDLRSNEFSNAGLGFVYDIIPSRLQVSADIDLQKSTKWERKQTLALRYQTECVAIELTSTQEFKDDDELEPPRVLEWKIDLLSSMSNKSVYRSRKCS